MSLSTAEKLIDELRQLLGRTGVRVLDLFRDWDTDGDGLIRRQEFTTGVTQLSPARADFERSADDDADAIFSFLEAKARPWVGHTPESLSFSELRRLLRPGVVTDAPHRGAFSLLVSLAGLKGDAATAAAPSDAEGAEDASQPDGGGQRPTRKHLT